MAAPARTGAHPRARAPLSRERVLRAALDYVDAHGLTALSMHKLGAELGVKGMSLYSHVDSKDALLDGIVEAMWAELELPDTTGIDWRDALRSYARMLRAIIRRHPNAAPLLVNRPVMPVHSLEVLDRYRGVLLRAGFAEDRALEALRTAVIYAQGHALAELSASCARPEPGEDDLSRLRWVTGMVPRDAPDHLVRLAITFCGGCDMDAQFELGLDLMVRGLEPEAAHQGGAAISSHRPR